MKKAYIFAIMALIVSAFFLTKSTAASSISFEDLGLTSVFMGRVGVQKFKDGNSVCYIIVSAGGNGAGISCVRVK